MICLTVSALWSNISIQRSRTLGGERYCRRRRRGQREQRKQYIEDWMEDEENEPEDGEDEDEVDAFTQAYLSQREISEIIL